MMIKAIDTHYKGYKFRSRLEARWAVFFDSLKIKWDYEPEGYELGDGDRYLPDFFIYFTEEHSKLEGHLNSGYFIEIKPFVVFSDKEREDIQRKSLKLARMTNHVVHIIRGDPRNFVVEIAHKYHKELLPRGYFKDDEFNVHCHFYRFNNKDDRACRRAMNKSRKARFEFDEAEE
jgi:hypothetical protein